MQVFFTIISEFFINDLIKGLFNKVFQVGQFSLKTKQLGTTPQNAKRSFLECLNWFLISKLLADASIFHIYLRVFQQ